jgi:hypothetical protein
MATTSATTVSLWRCLALSAAHREGQVGLQAGNEKPPLRSTPVDQLLGCQARPGTEVCQVTLHGAWPDPPEFGRSLNRPAARDEGREDLDLARRSAPRQLAPHVPILHARRLAAASHSSRPSIGRVSAAIVRPTPVGRVFAAFTRRTTPVDRHRTAGGCLSPLGGTRVISVVHQSDDRDGFRDLPWRVRGRRRPHPWTCQLCCSASATMMPSGPRT